MFETERLILREWQDSDIEPFTQMGQDLLVMEYFPALLSQQETLDLIVRIKTKYRDNGFCFYACELKSTHEFIGFIGLSVPSLTAHFTPCVEIGWRISSKHWGKGYATEGALKCLDVGFNQFKFEEIVSIAVKDNLKSTNVMSKIGMTRDFKGDFLHPSFAAEHKLAPHVLYRMKPSGFHQEIAKSN